MYNDKGLIRKNRTYKIEDKEYERITNFFKKEKKSISAFIRQTLIDFVDEKTKEEGKKNEIE